MKTTAAFASALLIATVLPAADLAPAEDAQSRVRENIPAYDPAIHAAEEARKAAQAVSPEDEVVVMPEMTVQDKSIRRMEEETLYKRGAWDKELVKRELSEFDRYFLNRYTLPLFGISKEQRARDAYIERKNREFKERLTNYADVLKTTDDQEAEALRNVMLDTARSGEKVASNARPANWR